VWLTGRAEEGDSAQLGQRHLKFTENTQGRSERTVSKQSEISHQITKITTCVRTMVRITM
jgi:hypothetical protein